MKYQRALQTNIPAVFFTTDGELRAGTLVDSAVTIVSATALSEHRLFSEKQQTSRWREALPMRAAMKSLYYSMNLFYMRYRFLNYNND